MQGALRSTGDPSPLPVGSRILVLGAGLAGLAAARALSARGYAVVIVEGRERPGGRCWTEDQFDFGAHWIHGTEGNPLTNLAHEFGLPIAFVGGDSNYTGGWEQIVLYGPGGRILTPTEKLQSILAADHAWERLEALRRVDEQSAAADRSLAAALDEVFRNNPLSDAERAAIDWHLTLMRDDWGSNLDSISSHWWDDGFEVFGYGDSIFLDGYSALVTALSAGLTINLGERVTEIAYDTPGERPVRVTTDRDAYLVDAVIVTAPLGVLKAGTIGFDPPLPAEKCTAIERLGVGVLAKVALSFAEPFWPRDQYVFGYQCAGPERSPTVIVNLWKTHRKPTLVLLGGGELGCWLEQAEESEVAAWAISCLRTMFGPDLPTPTALVRTAWTSDPFACGGYCFMPVGASPADIDVLTEPIMDRIFFAGEATSRTHWSTTHGAYLSGLREAARISGDVSILPARHFTENRRWRQMMHRTMRFFSVVSAEANSSDIDERLAILRNGEVFADVPPSELRLLAAMFEAVTYPAGSVICRMGDHAEFVYAVAAGTVEVQIGAGVTVRTLEPGDIGGEYGMFGDGVRTATLIARDEVRLLQLDYQRFRRFLLAFPDSALALLGIAARQLHSRNTQLSALLGQGM